MRSKATLQAAAAFHTDFHLIDAHVTGLYGGTGQTVDWDLVRRHKFSAPIILSGGLSPDNVAAAIAATEPFAVDVASGTEASPGVKDPEKLLAFAARRAVDVARGGRARRAGGRVGRGRKGGGGGRAGRARGAGAPAAAAAPAVSSAPAAEVLR